MKTLRLLVLSALVTSVLACGDDAEELTCAMLDDPDFCWNATAAEAYACTADQTEDAVTTDDGATCNYGDDGPTVEFETPLRQGAGTNKSSYTIERNGETCASFTYTEDRQTIRSNERTATFEGAGGTNIRFECDGVAYEGDFFSLSDDCGDDGVPLPGSQWSSGGTGISVSILPRPEEFDSPIVECNYEP